MAKGAKLRSIRRMIRLDLSRSDIVKHPSLVRNKKTNKLEKSTVPFQKTIINQNKIGYRKIKKQFGSSEAFKKAFGETPKQVEKKIYLHKLNTGAK